MGVFSSKKKTYVSTEVTRLYKDKDIPDMNQKNIIDSVFKKDQLTKTIINNALDSQTLKLERAYRRAARGDYYYGAPNSNVYSATDGRTALQNILEIEHEVDVRLDYFHFAPLNNLHYAWQVLTQDYGYDEFRNTLVLGGVKHWVSDVVGQINTTAITSDETAEEEQELEPDDGTLSVWDRHPQDRYVPGRTYDQDKTPVWLFDSEVPDGATVYLVDQAGNESSIFVDTAGFDRDLECFQAKYRYTQNGENRIGYFTYEFNHGEYPALDAVHNKTAVGKGTFFPVFIFRSYGVNRTASRYHDSAAYKSTVRLADSIGLDYQYLGDRIHDNEDANKLEQAVLMMGVPAKTGNAVEAEYLFRFFDRLYKESGATTGLGTNGVLDASRPGKAIRIRERDFDCTLSFSRLNRKHKTGSIGPADTYDCKETSITKYRYMYRRVRDTGGGYTTEAYSVPYSVKELRYRWQTSENTYQELTVENLKLRYAIYGSKGVDANVGNSKLIIPLDYYVARSMRYVKKDQLYYRSLHLVLNSKVTKTVKWYQRGAFQVVLVIVAVVISFWIGGADGGSLIGAALGVASGTAIALILAIVEAVVISLAVREAFKVVIKELGVEFGAVLSVVAFVAAMYGANVGSDWSTAAMQAGNNLASVSMEQHQKDVMAEYNEERQAFELLKEQKLAELEEAENLLQQYSLLDPRSFIAKEPQIIPGESPDSLYQRTVHTGNPGILQYDHIESYVDINTRLPTFTELVGENFI